MGAEILFYPTAIGWATSQDEATNTEQYNAWQTIQRSHSVANGVHVVSVNRVGLGTKWGYEILGRFVYYQSLWKYSLQSFTRTRGGACARKLI
jgi:predicted amidohydrolase